MASFRHSLNGKSPPDSSMTGSKNMRTVPSTGVALLFSTPNLENGIELNDTTKSLANTDPERSD